MIEEEKFKKSNFVEEKLLKYGFKKSNKKYIYEKNIIDNNFKIIITIENNLLKGKIIDLDLNEEYLGFRIENQIGEFASNIRNEYKKILLDIRNKCCINKYYISEQANRISDLILKKYGDIPEYLWDDDKNSVFRNQSNKKWYGIIMNINLNKITDCDKYK